MKFNQFALTIVASIALSSQPVLAQQAPAGAQGAGAAAAGTVSAVGVAIGVAVAAVIISAASNQGNTATTGTR